MTVRANAVATHIRSMTALDSRPQLVQRWNDNFDELQSYVATHGCLPARFGELHRLYSWAVLQRANHRRGTLAPDREERLRTIPGVLFEKRDPMGNLEDFYRINGRLPKISASKGSKEHSAAMYLIHGLRPRITKGAISASLLKRASAIPGAVDVRRVPDQAERLDELKEFIRINGYLPRNNPAESLLADWVRNTTVGDVASKSPALRQRHEAVAAIIEQTPTYHQAKWNEVLAEAEAFCKNNGHLPARGPEKSLSAWLGRQAGPLEAGDFDEVSSRRLQNVLAYPTAAEYNWQTHLDELKSFTSVHGRLPRGFHEHGYRWLCQQRKAFKEGTLTADRLEALSDVERALPLVGRKAA